LPKGSPSWFIATAVETLSSVVASELPGITVVGLNAQLAGNLGASRVLVHSLKLSAVWTDPDFDPSIPTAY
jgi:hypothetical protein